MPVSAIIPIRSFRKGKDRLAPGIDIETRLRLGMSLAERTVGAAEAAMLLPAIVSSDAEVVSWAVERALPIVEETGPGLNQAASDGVTWARESDLDWIVLHSDLPLVTADDLVGLESAASQGVSFIAPSADGGTTALSAPSPIEFTYGVASASRHMARLEDPQIFVTTGLLHDLDTMNDLASAWLHRHGKWLIEIVPEGLLP